MKKISILVPCYNEANNIKPLINEVATVIKKKPGYSFSLIFVDDGSKDNTVEVIKNLENVPFQVSLIELSRNFGKEVALTAGIHEAHGDALVIMDSDLQHPPSLIDDFIDKWQGGYDIVATKRVEIENRSVIKRTGSKLFHFLMRTMSDTDMVAGSTDFRLLDRCVVDELKRFTERNRLVRGMIDWLGFKKVYIEFTAPDRIHGEPGYTVAKLFKLAVNSLTSFSLLPLKFASFLGVIISTSSVVFFLWMIVDKYLFNIQNFSPLSYVIVVNTFLIGLVLICLGFIAIYIGNIHTEVVNRPLYVIKSKISFKSSVNEE